MRNFKNKITARDYILSFVLVVFLVGFLYIAAIDITDDETARVSYVYDGDTFKTEQGDWIRLALIDAPEKHSPKGLEATNYLKAYIENEEVELDCSGRGYYDRRICIVYDEDGMNVNTKLLELGVVRLYENNNY